MAKKMKKGRGKSPRIGASKGVRGISTADVLRAGKKVVGGKGFSHDPK